MCLRPLVENAIRFAVGDRPDGGHVRIAAEVVGGRLRLSVEDDGPGFAPDSQDGEGLRNLRRRLWSLHADAGELDTHNVSAGLTRVTITIPARNADPGAARRL